MSSCPGKSIPSRTVEPGWYQVACDRTAHYFRHVTPRMVESLCGHEFCASIALRPRENKAAYCQHCTHLPKSETVARATPGEETVHA